MPVNLISDKLMMLRESLLGVRLIEGAEDHAEFEQLRVRLIRILEDKLIPEAQHRLPLFVVIAGGTNVGKSSLMNWLTGMEISHVSAIARGTKSPLAAGRKLTIAQFNGSPLWPDMNLTPLQSQNDQIRETDQQMFFITESNAFPPANCLLIDSPDFDSDHVGNRSWADRLFILADAVLFVVTPEKYNDAIVIHSLNRLVNNGRTVAGIFNKSEDAESRQDFLSNIWKRHASRNAAHVIGRSADRKPSDPAARIAIQAQVSQWASESKSIKQTGVNGSLAELTAGCNQLLDRSNEEARWLESVIDELDGIVNRAVIHYINSFQTERFIEIDSVFARLMKKYRIPIIDDIYDPLRKISSEIFSRIRDFVLQRKNSAEAEFQIRQSQEKLRHATAFNTVRLEVMDLPSRIAAPIRKISPVWIENVSQTNSESLFPSYINEVDLRVSDWINEQTLKIDAQFDDKPAIRRFLIASKAIMQIGAGVLGAFLTGGFHSPDLLMGPAVERAAAFVIEKSIGAGFFKKMRTDLWNLRSALLITHLHEQLISKIRKQILALMPSVTDAIRAQADHLPRSEEIIS